MQICQGETQTRLDVNNRPGALHLKRDDLFQLSCGRNLYYVSMTPECIRLVATLIFMAIFGATVHLHVMGEHTYVTHSMIDNAICLW